MHKRILPYKGSLVNGPFSCNVPSTFKLRPLGEEPLLENGGCLFRQVSLPVALIVLFVGAFIGFEMVPPKTALDRDSRHLSA